MSQALRREKVLVIIPAYNEENSIGDVVREVRSSEPQFDILVVNDASTDRTASIARNMGVTVASLPFNLGIGGAVQTGFKYAKQHGYDIAVQVDADGQHDATFLGRLIAPIVKGETDISVGSRFLYNGNSKPPFVRQGPEFVPSPCESLKFLSNSGRGIPVLAVSELGECCTIPSKRSSP